MQIKHPFVSGKSDGTDATLVQPSNWNAGHAMTIAANNVVVGNNAGTNQPAAELTASQILDMVANAANGSLLWRNAGTWTGLSNLLVENSDLVCQLSSATAPAVAGAKTFASAVAGRNMLHVYPSAPGGGSPAPYTLQPHIGRKRVSMWVPRYNSTSIDIMGAVVAFPAGGLTARPWASTNLFTSSRRVGMVSGAVAGNQAAIDDNTTVASCWLGNAAGLGGFHNVWRFGISDAVLVGTANMFCGLISTVYAGDVGPQTQPNLIGVGCSSGDTSLQIYGAGSVAQARTPLGTNFPCNTVSTDWYELALWAPPNATIVYYQVTRLNTGHVASGSLTGAQIPLNTVGLNPEIIRSNGGTASAVGFDLGVMYLETDS